MSYSALIVLGVSYLFLCALLRYRRRDKKHADYPYKTRADFARMTVEHAQQIQEYIYQLEFPWVANKALEFALFKYV